MSKKFTLTATNLRIILAVSLVVITAIGAGGFALAYNWLDGFAADASTVASQAAASESELQELSQTEKMLKTQHHAVERASKIAAESKSYQYQDQIINDLNDFARKAGITISDITFADDNAKGGSSSSSSSSSSKTGTSLPAIAGLKATTASVTVKNPVEYRKLLTFMYLVEQSLTKMRIANVDLSRSTAQGQPPDSITSNTLTIEVYLRS
ncbi:hypothetical protein HG437_002405 [Candidatus Saccharibacteria bacterium]|nr:hypothetical protein [Candidatus Saccharibacteria bacterium]